MSLLEYIQQIFYDALGHTGSSYYYRFVRESDGYIYDAVAKEVVASPTWADSSIAMVEIGTTGAFPLIVSADLPSGRYNAVIYKRLGSLPQNTDDVEDNITVTKGGIFGF